MIMFEAFVLGVIIVTGGMMLAAKLGLIEFVSSSRLLFKSWSVWLGSVGATLSALIQAFPDATLSAWKILPDDIKALIPENIFGILAAFMIAMAVISQFIRQKGLSEIKNRNEGKV